MTVAAAEALLPSRPDWVERVEQLAIELRAMAGRTAPPPAPGEQPADSDGFAESPEELQIDTDRLLLAYNQLWQFVHDLRSEGLSLDETFCERIEREWSVTTLLTYIRNADGALQQQAEKTLETASGFLASKG